MKDTQHYIQMIFGHAFERHPFAKLFKIHPVANGWCAILKCESTKQEYVVHIYPIKSEVEIKREQPLMFSDFEKTIKEG